MQNNSFTCHHCHQVCSPQSAWHAEQHICHTIHPTSQGLHHSQSLFSTSHYLSFVTPLSKPASAVITADSSLKGLKNCYQDPTPFTSFHELRTAALTFHSERQMFNNGCLHQRLANRRCSHPPNEQPRKMTSVDFAAKVGKDATSEH